MDIDTQAQLPRKRVVFIDVLRAYAILMMLQGHFIDTMLHPSYRSTDYTLYAIWEFMRGMTAPIFFFTTGLIFVFLLLKQDANPYKNIRVKKGIRRGLYIIFIGYLLHLNFFVLLSGHFSDWYLAVDVLHCIGLAILGIIGLFVFSYHTRLPFVGLLAVSGLLVFYYSPQVKAMDWSGLPLFLEQYMSKANGSIFTPIPWLGFTFLGGLMGGWLHHNQQLAFKWYFPAFLMGLGLLLHYHSWTGLVALHQLTGLENLPGLFNNNYLFWRLGHVFVVMSIVVSLCIVFTKVPKLLTKIGSETLAIYSVHYIILYGSWFGLGLAQLWRKSLTPLESAIGAALFLIAFVVMVYYIEDIRNIRDHKIKAFFKQTWQQIRNWFTQLYFKLAHRRG
ncbi:MAG: DUF1624 domain-containing protein [Saprospiraceae bacterium]|nr:DUF1624 domain-containing protein [Saprospiraceae bacterium]